MLVHRPVRYFRHLSVLAWQRGSKRSVHPWDMENSGCQNLCSMKAGSRQGPSPVPCEQHHPPGSLHPGLYANNLAGYRSQLLSHLLFSLFLPFFPKKKKMQKFIPLCISAWCNGAKHFSFIIIMPVKGTPNNVNAGEKPLGFICMAALSSFSTQGVKWESMARATSLASWPSGHCI